MNQDRLRKMAVERLRDARVLLKGKRWAYAYYVAGYAVECALKSCVLSRLIHTGWVFEEKVRLDDCRTHDFQTLVRVAGLSDSLNDHLRASASAGKEFVRHWGLSFSGRSRVDTS